MNGRLQGIIPALMTPFTDDTSAIDRVKTASLVKKLKSAGVHGLYTGGSSGEMLLCSIEERMELLETVMEERDELTVIAHVGAMSTADSIRLARHAERVGADAISSVTPLYYNYTFSEIKTFYRRLCESVQIPVILYSIPALSGTALPFDQLSELLSLHGIGGMKFTSSDFFLLNRLKNAFTDKVFYNGSDEMLLSGLSAGADGGIGTTYNFMPHLFLEIYNRFLAGDYTRARQVQSLANQVIACVNRHSLLPAAKHMMNLTGLDIGICREPFLPLSEEEKEELYQNAYKLLP